MIIDFYVRAFLGARGRSRRLWSWARRHPRWSAVIVLATGWMVLSVIGATSAYADGSGPISLPYLPPTDIEDSHGVTLSQYAILPLDRGTNILFSFNNSLIASIVDPIWTASITAIGWLLWLFQFLLGFTWVTWISAPLNGIATFVHGILSQIGWIPLALVAAAIIGGLVMLSGRYSKGGAEIAISVLCSVLAVGLLANPVSALTGSNGALHWAESWGANLSASIAENSTTASTSTPSIDDATKVISSTISTQLMDIFVREPAQVIAFGHELTGNCDTIFTEQMKTASPIDSGSTSVRDAVSNCDPDAGNYVSHPNFGQVLTVLITSNGSGILFALGAALAIVLMMCVGYSLFQAMKLMFAVYAAVAPGIARRSLWNSLLGMYIGAISVGITVVLLAVYLKIITSVMTSAAGSGLNIVAQTGIIDLVVTVLIISLFVARHKAKKAGETIAERLSRLGFGGGSQPKSNPVLGSAARVAQRYVGDKLLLSSGKRPAVTSKAAVAAASGPRDVGEYTATTGRRGGSGSAEPNRARAIGAGVVSKTASGISAAAQLAAAASTGGTSAVVMKASTIAGKTVLQRQLRGGNDRPTSKLQEASRYGRQIVVDRDGVSKIAPRPAPRQNGAYNVTTLPRRSHQVGASPVRAALERAARGTVTPS